MSNYKYEIGISLCKQDLEFARGIRNELNPSLKIFDYESRQQELISKSAPMEFASIFKDQCRVVVILSRKEWGTTTYTKLEQNAITDKAILQGKGFNHLIVIPMVAGEIPSWYSSSMVYIDPEKYSFERIAGFIEFIVTQQGGVVEPITLEKRYNWFHEKLNLKNELIKLQETQEALNSSKEELEKIKAIFNQKIDFLISTQVAFTSQIKFDESKSSGSFALNQYCLECRCLPSSFNIGQLKLPQDATIQIELFEAVHGSREIIEQMERTFYFSSERIGWAEKNIIKPERPNDKLLLYGNRANNQMFNLQNPVSSEEIIDLWFQKLFIVATSKMESFL